MKILCPNVAVPTQSKINASGLERMICSADACISDLDYTDTRFSPAEDLVFRRVGLTAANSLTYASWAAATAMSLAAAKLCRDAVALEAAKKRRFKRFERQILRRPDTLYQTSETALRPEVVEELQRLLTPDYLDSSLYPGVTEFYQALPQGIEKGYLSANIHPVVKAYADKFGFDWFKFDVRHKEIELQSMILTHPGWRRLVLRVDGPAEYEMVDLARRFQKNGRLAEVLVLKRSPQMKADFTGCDVIIGKDDYGLVGLLQER